MPTGFTQRVGIEGNVGNTLQGFAVGLAVAAELQLRLPDVYIKEG